MENILSSFSSLSFHLFIRKDHFDARVIANNYQAIFTSHLFSREILSLVHDTIWKEFEERVSCLSKMRSKCDFISKSWNTAFLLVTSFSFYDKYLFVALLLMSCRRKIIFGFWDQCVELWSLIIESIIDIVFQKIFCNWMIRACHMYNTFIVCFFEMSR